MSALGTGGDVCYFCNKRVFLMEKKTLAEKVFHQACFKCQNCKASMPLDSQVHWLDGKLYCKLHYLREQDARAKKNPASAAVPASVSASVPAPESTESSNDSPVAAVVEN